MYRMTTDKTKPYEVITYHEIWYGDLETLVKNAYGVDIRVTDMLDYPNQDTYLTIDVNGKDELDGVEENYQDIIDEFLQEGFTYHMNVNLLFHQLHKDGHLPSGKYLLTIWW